MPLHSATSIERSGSRVFSASACTKRQLASTPAALASVRAFSIETRLMSMPTAIRAPACAARMAYMPLPQA